MIALDKEDFEQINKLPFIKPSTSSVEEQIGRIPDNVRPQVFQLLQTIITSLNSEYRLVKLSTIKEKEVTDVSSQ
jgi:hypothetical protein